MRHVYGTVDCWTCLLEREEFTEYTGCLRNLVLPQNPRTSMKIKPYFKNHEAMLAEADTLVAEDRWDAEDRATIQDFYNGRETMTKAEAEARGAQNVTNHLFGYDSISL